MKRFLSILLAVAMLSCSVCFAESRPLKQNQIDWQNLYQAILEIGDNPTRIQFSKVLTLCIYYSCNDAVDSENSYNAIASMFGNAASSSQDSSKLFDSLSALSNVQNKMTSSYYDNIFEMCAHAAKCEESGEYTWGPLKKYSYGYGYAGTAEFDRELYQSMK